MGQPRLHQRGRRVAIRCEVKIDKKGFVIQDGKKTKSFWGARITSAKKPLRLRVRNIAGDESTLPVS